jgi:hypothetical protein
VVGKVSSHIQSFVNNLLFMKSHSGGRGVRANCISLLGWFYTSTMVLRAKKGEEQHSSSGSKSSKEANIPVLQGMSSFLEISNQVVDQDAMC